MGLPLQPVESKHASCNQLASVNFKFRFLSRVSRWAMRLEVWGQEKAVIFGLCALNRSKHQICSRCDATKATDF